MIPTFGFNTFLLRGFVIVVVGGGGGGVLELISYCFSIYSKAFRFVFGCVCRKWMIKRKKMGTQSCIFHTKPKYRRNLRSTLFNFDFFIMFVGGLKRMKRKEQAEKYISNRWNAMKISSESNRLGDKWGARTTDCGANGRKAKPKCGRA